jgi:hypothetical protein
MESRINYVLFSEKKIPKNIGEIFLKSLWTFYPDRSYPILRYLLKIHLHLNSNQGHGAFGTVLPTRNIRNSTADTGQPEQCHRHEKAEKVTPKRGGRKSTAGHGTIGPVLPTSGRRTKASERNKII